METQDLSYTGVATMYQGETQAAVGGGQALSIRRRRYETPRAGRAQGFQGMSDGITWGNVGSTLPGPTGIPQNNPFPSSGGDGGGGFDWSSIFGNILGAAPAIISSVRGQGVPAGYYPTNSPGYTQQQYQQIPPGYAYINGQLVSTGSAASAGAQAGAGVANLANSVSTFVTQNPLIVLGGTVALLLLFKSPPRR